jgi:hypothetical protein
MLTGSVSARPAGWIEGSFLGIAGDHSVKGHAHARVISHRCGHGDDDLRFVYLL